MTQCTATTAEGKQCRRQSTSNNLCRQHGGAPKVEAPTLEQRIKTVLGKYHENRSFTAADMFREIPNQPETHIIQELNRLASEGYLIDTQDRRRGPVTYRLARRSANPWRRSWR